MTEQNTAPIVILGSGLAGYGVAKEFRKLDGDTPLLIITADDGRSYSKPMLSTGFTKDKTAAALAMANAGDMATQLKATIRTQARVESIDPQSHTITVSGEEIQYAKLVMALGAETNKAPLEGDGLDQVYSINDLVDYEAFRQALVNKSRVAIIGAGLIGCEFANDLINGGFEVEVITPTNTVLTNMLPEPAAEQVQLALQEAGAKFHMGAMAQRVIKTESGVKVCLSSGVEIEADAVVSAVGLRPSISLAAKAGLSCDRGIQVNKKLETSADDIYALGDCAEVEGLSLLYVLPLMASARALAKTLAGNDTEVSYGPMPVVVKTPVCPLVVASPADTSAGEWSYEGEGRNLKCLFHNAEGELTGFVLTGDQVVEKLNLSKKLPNML